MMIHSRIDSGTMRDRLDASYYTPEVLENEAQLRARGATALRTLIDTDASNYGVLPPSEDYQPSGSGVPLIRGGDLDRGTIRDPEIDAPLSFKNARGTANAGDVLLLIKGACIDSPAGVALVSERHAGSVFNGSCYRVKVAPACDAGYLVAYCQTRQLLLQKKREIANTGIAYNAEDSVLGYLVPALELDAQRYIGDKVRQAERLRERARRLESEAVAAMTRALGEPPEEWVVNTGFVGVFGSGGFRTRIKPNELRGRLDPAGYHPELRAIGTRASKAGTLFCPLLDLADVVTDSRPLVSSSKGVDAYVSVLHIDERGFVDMTAASTHKPESNGRACVPGDVLLSGINPAANRIGVCGEFSGSGACSPEFTILESKTAVDPHYLAYVLRSFVCLRQLIHLGQGTSSSRRRVDETELSNLQVPILDDADRIGQAIAIRQGCFAASQQLTQAAKLIVEHLIDGRLTEADLVSARKTLEAGDRSVDREILKSLRQGDAPDAKPLIADVDALYALLDGLEGQEP